VPRAIPEPLHNSNLRGGGTEKDITAAFSGKQFPLVRTVVIPSYAHQILAACPNVRQVMYGSEAHQPWLFEILKKHCHHVEVLPGFSLVNCYHDKFAGDDFHTSEPLCCTTISFLNIFPLAFPKPLQKYTQWSLISQILGWTEFVSVMTYIVLR
jgi:hypothetical protein